MSNLFQNIKYVWFYITEKCPLSCDYCYFRDRSSNEGNISLRTVKFILENLPLEKEIEFIISGGEPFLEIDLIKKISLLIREKFKDNLLIVQTSGFLIEKDIIPFIKKNKIRIELGVDGDFETMKRHRKGINKERFEKIIENIKLLQKNKIPICPTMSIHPQEAKNLWKNFLFLESLGLNHIDVSPVFLGKWENFQVKEFKKQYLKIIRYILNFKKFSLLSYGYDKPLGMFWKELNILPSGDILSSWILMSLPRSLKEKYKIARINDKENKIDLKNLIFFRKKVNDFFNKRSFIPNRRELNAFYGKMVFEKVAYLYKLSNKNFKNYRDISIFIGKINNILASYLRK